MTTRLAQSFRAELSAIRDDLLEASYAVGGDAPVSLRFLIEDYLRHQRWHLTELTAPVAAK